jgi:DASS family divalent anion:Na+ symporter
MQSSSNGNSLLRCSSGSCGSSQTDARNLYKEEVLWSCFVQGFEKTGLGERVATLFVKLFGKSTLGLAYG